MLGRRTLNHVLQQSQKHLFGGTRVLAAVPYSRPFSLCHTPLSMEKASGSGGSRFRRRGTTTSNATVSGAATAASSSSPALGTATPTKTTSPSSEGVTTSSPHKETKASLIDQTSAPLAAGNAAAGEEEGLASTSPSTTGSDSPPEEATTPPPPPPPPESGIQKLLASWQQGVVASIGAVMGIGFIVYLLYTPVKEDTVHHTAVVASEALGDIRLKGKALQLSKDIVVSVLQDDQSLELVVELVRKLLAQEDTKIAISSLLQSLFEDHYTQEVTKKFVLMIVRDPWIMDQLQVIAKEQVLRLLQDESIKKALSQFLTDSTSKSLEDPELQYETARAVRRSLIAVVNPWSGV